MELTLQLGFSGDRGLRRHGGRGAKAYVTLEAALLLPILIGAVLFVIYMMLFQYNRCLMNQDLGAMALWGSIRQSDDGKRLEAIIRERMDNIYRDKYIAWHFTELKAGVKKNYFEAEGIGKLTFPFPGWNFWSSTNVWEAKSEYRYRRFSPVDFIRLCRGLKNGLRTSIPAPPVNSGDVHN